MLQLTADTAEGFPKWIPRPFCVWGLWWGHLRASAGPAHGGKAAKLRGRRNSVTLLANSEWERSQTKEPDLAIFEREIQPKLKTASLLETMRATGLSRTYCEMIRRGVRVPHPRHWEALRELVSAQVT